MRAGDGALTAELAGWRAQSDGQVTVRPAAFHSVMDAVPAEGSQLVQEPDRLVVLLADVPDSFDEDGLADRLRRELRSRGCCRRELKCSECG